MHYEYLKNDFYEKSPFCTSQRWKDVRAGMCPSATYWSSPSPKTMPPEADLPEDNVKQDEAVYEELR